MFRIRSSSDFVNVLKKIGSEELASEDRSSDRLITVDFYASKIFIVTTCLSYLTHTHTNSRRHIVPNLMVLSLPILDTNDCHVGNFNGMIIIKSDKLFKCYWSKHKHGRPYIRFPSFFLPFLASID